MTQFKSKPADDLELYEVIVAAYPDKFQEGDDDIWDDVMEFVEETFGDIDNVCDLIGRLVLLSSPMVSAISKNAAHCLGKVVIENGQTHMIAAISRKYQHPTTTEGNDQ